MKTRNWKKPPVKQVKALVDKLLKKELSDVLLEARYEGPFAEEDLCVDLVLKEEPPDMEERMERITLRLDRKGLDVLFDWWVVDEARQAPAS